MTAKVFEAALGISAPWSVSALLQKSQAVIQAKKEKDELKLKADQQAFHVSTLALSRLALPCQEEPEVGAAQGHG